MIVRDLLLSIWDDNDYVLSFEATQEVRDIASELRRLWTTQVVGNLDSMDTSALGVILEPLLGYFIQFTNSLERDIERDKLENDESHREYLEEIKLMASKSIERIVEWQFEAIKK